MFATVLQPEEAGLDKAVFATSCIVHSLSFLNFFY